jgi:hypothetical protein
MGDGMLVCPKSAVGTFGGVMSPAPVEPFSDIVGARNLTRLSTSAQFIHVGRDGRFGDLS